MPCTNKRSAPDWLERRYMIPRAVAGSARNRCRSPADKPFPAYKPVSIVNVNWKERYEIHQ
jgi:hypothetical protein